MGVGVERTRRAEIDVVGNFGIRGAGLEVLVQLVLQGLDVGKQNARQRCAVCTGSQPVPDAGSFPSGPLLVAFVPPQDLTRPVRIRGQKLGVVSTLYTNRNKIVSIVTNVLRGEELLLQ